LVDFEEEGDFKIGCGFRIFIGTFTLTKIAAILHS